MKYLFILLSCTLSFYAQSEMVDNEFNCDSNFYKNSYSEKSTNIRATLFKARSIVRYKNHNRLKENKFFEFFNLSNVNDSFNAPLFSCLVAQDLGYDYQTRMINIKYKIKAQKQKRQMEKYKKIPINMTSVVFLGSLASGINIFVFQDFVKQSTTDRKLDADKLMLLINEYKNKNPKYIITEL
jgi:hypothetical protein